MKYRLRQIRTPHTDKKKYICEVFVDDQLESCGFMGLATRKVSCWRPLNSRGRPIYKRLNYMLPPEPPHAPLTKKKALKFIERSKKQEEIIEL